MDRNKIHNFHFIYTHVHMYIKQLMIAFDMFTVPFVFDAIGRSLVKSPNTLD
jgi:hypothetical protein